MYIGDRRDPDPLGCGARQTARCEADGICCRAHASKKQLVDYCYCYNVYYYCYYYYCYYQYYYYFYVCCVHARRRALLAVSSERHRRDPISFHVGIRK